MAALGIIGIIVGVAVLIYGAWMKRKCERRLNGCRQKCKCVF